MKTAWIVFLLLCALPVWGETTQSAVVRGPVRLDDADPNATLSMMEHRIGAVRASLSNYGVWGNPNSYPGFHSWEWPINSGNNFLFSAGLWVGAEINGVHRVSTTVDGDNGTGEFWPEHIGTRPPTNPSADWWVQSCCLEHHRGRDYELSDSIPSFEDLYAAFQDSISASYVRSMDNDGHIPLNVEITQRTHDWPGILARDIIFVDYRIRNRGSSPLHHLYLALFADPDIGAAGETGDAASINDGNLFDSTRLMAVQGKFNFWNGAQTPGLYAMKVTGTPVPLNQLRLTFRNFGRLAGGDPASDASKYNIMSSGVSSSRSSTNDDWRMVLAFGPTATDGFDLVPDSILRISVAFLSGANLDSLNINAARAQALFDSGYDYHPTAPVENFRVVSTSSGSITLGWSPPRFGSYTGYNLFGRDSAGTGRQESFNTTLITDSTFTVTGLLNGMDWLFQLETIDSSGERSLYAEVLGRVAAALPVRGLHGVTENGVATLIWDPSPESNVVGYRITRIVQPSPGVYDTSRFNSTEPFFDDHSGRLGYDNIYRVQAVNDLGLYSFYSDSVVLPLWNPQHRILLMDETYAYSLNNGCISPDSAEMLYRRLLNAIGESYDYCHEPGCGVVDSLSQYDLVIWVNENRSTLANSTREDLLRRYVRFGGRLLRISREFFVGNGIASEGMHQDSYVCAAMAPLDLDSVYASVYHSYNPGMQFSGATAVLPGFPDATVDTSRMHSIHFGSRIYDYLPEVDLLWPSGETRALYRTAVLPTDSSGFANQPCGVIGPGEILLTFALYFLHEGEAQHILSACIDSLRHMTVVTAPPMPIPVPATSFLGAGYPNPFNPVTTLQLKVAKMTHVQLAIYNLLGQQVTVLMDGVLTAGEHSMRWDASDCASGIYFARLDAGTVTQTRKLILLK